MTKTWIAGLALAIAAISGSGLAQAQQTGATCAGRAPTMVFPSTRNSASNFFGTQGDDVIITGPGAEIVHGLAGDDTICVRGGNDTVYGGTGDDEMLGGAGRDTLSGKGGLDRARGGRGHDACKAERKRGCERREHSGH